MKRLLILTMFGALLGGLAGCRFMDCLWRGPSCQQTQAPAVTYTNPCPAYTAPCDPGCSAPTMMPGPITTTP